jgi:hypothetical protein
VLASFLGYGNHGFSFRFLEEVARHIFPDIPAVPALESQGKSEK